jgi:hypothetical protein
MALACCYACGSDLEPEYGSEAEALAHEQWNNALVIVLEGGYAMFIDPIVEDGEAVDPQRGILQKVGEYKIVICHECAHALCETVPWLEKLIDPLNSHAHRVGRDYGDHKGWDLPHAPTSSV